jgi:hypothetical protein
VKPHRNRPVVITDAERSQEDQLRIREVRYVLMMSIRVISVVAAVVVFTLQPPGLWVWLALCAFGMTIVPWVAVVLANDRLPKEEHRWRRFRPGGRRALTPHRSEPTASRGITAGEAPSPHPRSGEETEQIIDVDPPAGPPR